MVMLSTNKEMFTATEVAHLLNVHINTIRRWSNQGVLKTYRIGPRGDRRFSKDDLENFLNHNGRGNSNGNGSSNGNDNGHTATEITLPKIEIKS